MLIPGLNRATDRQRLQLGRPYWLLNDDTHMRVRTHTHQALTRLLARRQHAPAPPLCESDGEG